MKKFIVLKKLKELNSWGELKNIAIPTQMRIVTICYFKALQHWQTWLAMLFLGIWGYISMMIGLALNLKIGIFNPVGLLGAGIGGGIFAIVITQQAKKHLNEVMKPYINKKP